MAKANASARADMKPPLLRSLTIACVLILLAIATSGCGDEPTDSAAILPPESPLHGVVIEVSPEGDDTRFVIKAERGQRVSLSTDSEEASRLAAFERSREPVRIVTEVRGGELEVVSIEPSGRDV